MPRALVTGASGFIGSHLVEALLSRGDEVRALVRASSNRQRLAAQGVSFAVGDINDPSSLTAAVADVDVVYHLAAMLKQPWHPDFLTTNADGVHHVVVACAKAARPPTVVMTSSVAAVGPTPDGAPMGEDVTPRPVSKYGRSKLNGELAARELAHTVPISVVRPPAVFGERDSAMLPLFRTAAFGFNLVPSGGASLSVIHVADLVAALIAAAERGERLPGPDQEAPAGQGIYFAADERRPTIREFGGLLGEAFGKKHLWVIPAPRLMSTVVGACAEAAARLRGVPSIVNLDKMTEANAGSWIVSADKAARQLGWRTGASLPERLAQTATWYRSEGWL